MHVIKKTTLLAIASLCTTATNQTTAQTKAPPNSPQVLFVQTAKNVAFKDGILTLEGVSPGTTFFSDRPNRIVGQIRNDLFLKQWTEGKNSFKNESSQCLLDRIQSRNPADGSDSCAHQSARCWPKPPI